MGSTPTTIPPLDAAAFAQRMVSTFPPGWAAPEARSPGGVVYGVFATLGVAPAFVTTALEYALAATRIQTAQNGALDLAGQDYFGATLPRTPGETDDSYRARMLAAMLPTGATRQAVSDAVRQATGFTPRIIEPFQPKDTGAWGRFYWSVDTIQTPFRWTDGGKPLAYQGFIEAVLPLQRPIGNNSVPCYDSSFYWSVAGSSFFDLSSGKPQGEQAVLDAILRTKCEGTIAWVKFVSPPAAVSWDQPGINWDDPNVRWDQ